jgi:hypothetical protein
LAQFNNVKPWFWNEENTRKLLESVFKDRIMIHLKRHKLIRNSQHGFLPGRNCTTNLLSFFEKVTSQVDSGGAFDTIFLDVGKAFDKVPKARLFKKVKAHGISGQLLNWIKNWLTNRRHGVVHMLRLDRSLVRGPTGQSSGPLLLLLFINNLDLAASEVTAMAKFADDTKIGQEIVSAADRDALQSALAKLCTWTEVWWTQFNVAKCKAMHFGRSNPKFN